MRYFKYLGDDLVPGATSYSEFDQEGRPLRQVTLQDNFCLSSNVRDPLWGLQLGDQRVEDFTDPEALEIDRDEFEQAWDVALKRHESVWLRSQQSFPVGELVQGTLACFYPQGALVALDQETLGLVPSAELIGLYPGAPIKATVAGFDQRQHWVLLREAKTEAPR